LAQTSALVRLKVAGPRRVGGAGKSGSAVACCCCRVTAESRGVVYGALRLAPPGAARRRARAGVHKAAALECRLCTNGFWLDPTEVHTMRLLWVFAPWHILC
jgi:hypothetical protein